MSIDTNPSNAKSQWFIGKECLGFWVKVTPNSSKNSLLGWMSVDERKLLRISLTAPPVEGKANEVLTKFLAKVLDVKPRHVEIVTGHTSRIKYVNIHCLKPHLLGELLAKQH